MTPESPSSTRKTPALDWQKAYARLEHLRASLETDVIDTAGRERILRERAAMLARPTIDDADRNLVGLLGFVIGGQTYAIPVDQAVALVKTELLQLPELDGLHRGVFLYRGALVAAIDLARLLGRMPAAVTKSTAVLIVEANGRHLGLVADEVLGISMIPGADLSDLSERTGASDHISVRAATREGWLVLDADYIGGDARLVVDQDVQIVHGTDVGG